VRVVLDTNVVVSGLLWLGSPHDVLVLAASGAISPCATEAMLAELHAVLTRPKFRQPIIRRRTTVDELVTSVAATVLLFEPKPVVLPQSLRDHSDAMFLACAIAAHASVIVSGDSHLLEIDRFEGIRIVSASSFLSDIL
jgi:uncharacterized protein